MDLLPVSVFYTPDPCCSTQSYQLEPGVRYACEALWSCVLGSREANLGCSEGSGSGVQEVNFEPMGSDPQLFNFRPYGSSSGCNHFKSSFLTKLPEHNANHSRLPADTAPTVRRHVHPDSDQEESSLIPAT